MKHEQSLLLLMLQLQIDTLNLQESDQRLMTSTGVDDRQLPSMKKMFKKSTKSSCIVSCQLVSLLRLLAYLLVQYI